MMPEYIDKDDAYLAVCEHWDGDMLPGDFDDIIRAVPSADVAPVVYAEWIGIWGDGYADGSIVYEEFECSYCGFVHHADGEPTWDYCPNCGARMTEKEKAMTKYGEGYILKESLIDLVEWDNDIEQWVIGDNNFDYLMTKNENLDKKNENDSWVEQEVIYRDGKVWFQIDGEFIEVE